MEAVGRRRCELADAGMLLCVAKVHAEEGEEPGGMMAAKSEILYGRQSIEH